MEPMKVVYFGVPLPVKYSAGSCRLCGCTEERSCDEGCSWYGKPGGICTACAEKVLAIIEPPRQQQGRVGTALLAETNRNVLAVAKAQAGEPWRRALVRKRDRELRGRPARKYPCGDMADVEP